ncbi:MAG: hypothetical protein JSR58_06280 [Verrucomicrobia bacterium]|nr:hypothetical protein [Verrucomicrobiota bacterium]
MTEVAGVGAEQEINATAARDPIEREWNGSTVVYLHQPNFFFLNIDSLKLEDNSKELKLRISQVPDEELLKRIRELLEMQGFGDAKVQIVTDPIAVKV